MVSFNTSIHPVASEFLISLAVMFFTRHRQATARNIEPCYYSCTRNKESASLIHDSMLSTRISLQAFIHVQEIRSLPALYHILTNYRPTRIGALGIYLRGDISYKQGLEIYKPPIICRANHMHGLYKPLIEAVAMYEVCQ